MHRTLLQMLLIMMIHHNNGFYIKESNTPPKNSKAYRISSNDLYSLPKCEEKVKFNHNENLVITYEKRYQEINANPVSDVFLELTVLGNDVTQQTCNISGVTLNMTQCKLNGHSVIIRLSSSFCNQRELAITTYFTVYIDGTVIPEDQCPDPGIPENSHSNGNNGNFVVGTNIQFSCYEGYVMSGSDAISCIRNPHTDLPVWSGDKPKCLRQCEVPSAPKYGSVSQLSSNGSVNFACLSPFTLVGPKTITCLQNGAKTTWDKFPPKCVVTKCPSNEHVISTMGSAFIATPGFPGEIIYPNMTCQWNIRVRDDGCMHIYFATFDIPNDAVFEIHTFVGSISGEGSLVWSSRSGGGGPRTVCGNVIRVSYTSGEVAVTGHGGVQMWYQARPISEYHAAYQRAAGIGFNDQVSVEPTKATGQTKDDNSSGVDVAAIAAGVTVTVIVLIVVGVAIYIWYRKKYPVRMIIGKDFGKFTNPAYNRKTSTATLTRPDSFEKEIQKMASETCVSHDNPVDLSDEQEYQPTTGLTLLGSLGIREGMDDLDSPEMKKRNNTRQRRKIVPSTKVVIEEEEEADKDEVKKILDSSDSSSSDGEKSAASDDNSDGEGFRPVTDAPKIKRKRVSAYLNEVLDRQSSQDSTDGDADGTIKEEMTPSNGTDEVLQHDQQHNEEVMPPKECEVNTNDAVDESADGQNDTDAVEQKEVNKHADDVSKSDRPMTVLQLGTQDFKFTDEGSSQPSTSSEEDDIKEESTKTENNPTPETKHEVDFTPEEIITEVNNLLQEEAQSSMDNTVKLSSDDDVNNHEPASDHPKDTEKEINDVKTTVNETTGSEQADEVGSGNFPDGNDLSTNEVDMISVSTDLMNVIEVRNELDNTSTIPSLLGEIQQDSIDQLNDSDASQNKMADMQTDATVTPTISESTTGVLDDIDQNAYANQDIIGYLTKDEMREFTARSKSFGEDSLSSVYSGEMVEVDNPVAEIPEQEFSSGLNIDETDNLEVPYKNKAELQFEQLIQDIDNNSSSTDIEKVDNVIEIVNQEEIRLEKKETLISLDLSAGNITNGGGGETSDFISHFDNSDDTLSQTVNASPSLVEEFGNVTETTPTQPLAELSFVGDTTISTMNPLVQPVKLLMSGFDIGESSTDTHSEINPDNQIGDESNSEDDSNSSKISNKNVIEYIINPETLETSDEEDEEDDQVDELQRITEAGGKGKRRSISLENPLFDTLDFSQFQQNSLDSKQEDSDKESDNDTEMKPSLIRRRESVSLDNPFFDTDDHEVQTQPHQGEKLKVIQVSNLLVTPPTSSNESSDEESGSETGSVGEYQINPPSNNEENKFSDREDNASSKQAENASYEQGNDPSKHQQQPADLGLPVGVMNFSALEPQSGHANNLENTIPLEMPLVFDPRKKANLDAAESDVSSLDSATMKEIDNLSSDSEASNQDNGHAQANAPAQKRFSLSSISRKLKSSFKTTGKSDLQTGDNDMVDV